MTTSGPIESKFRGVMVSLAKGVDMILNRNDMINKKNGFMLFVFDTQAKEGRANYISNIKREDAVPILKEWLARAEGMDINSPETKQ